MGPPSTEPPRVLEWLRPPDLPDPEQAERARFLHVAMLATIAASVAAVAFAPMEATDYHTGLPAVAAAVAVNAFGLWAIRRGYVRSIGLAYSLVCSAILVAMQFATGANPVLLTASFINLTFVVGFTVGSAAALVFGLSAATWIGITIWLDWHGALPEPPWAQRPVDSVIQAVAPLLVTAVILAYGLRRLRAAVREARAGQTANLARAREGARIADLGQYAVQMHEPEQFVEQVVATAVAALELPCVAAYDCGDTLTLAAAAGTVPAPEQLSLANELNELCHQPSHESHSVSLDADGLRAVGGGVSRAGMWAFLVSVPRRLQPGGALLALAPDPGALGEPQVAFLRTCATLLGAAADRAEADAQLRQAQKMEVVGQLAGSVAHDFNNLLTGILGSAELAALGLDPSHPVAPLLRDISKAGEHAALLTRQLLAFSRKERLRPEVLDAREVVTSLDRILNRLMGEHIELSTPAAGEPAPVLADRGGLEQIVLNLCLNARDAVGRGGRIAIEVGTGSHRGGGESRPGESFVFLAVEDNGCGMDSETRARIYEPFFTTKSPEHGTGLGLATVHALVREFGGEILVSSEVGQGSRFEVRFPRIARENSQDAGPTEDRAPAGQGELILLVEDHVMARRALERALQRHGYRIRVASDGVEALKTLEQHEDVAVIVSDISMPRMGGDELLQLIRQRNVRTPVIFLSGYPSVPDRTGRQVSTLDAPVLAKPVATDELLRTIRQALEAARQATPAA